MVTWERKACRFQISKSICCQSNPLLWTFKQSFGAEQQLCAGLSRTLVWHWATKQPPDTERNYGEFILTFLTIHAFITRNLLHLILAWIVSFWTLIIDKNDIIYLLWSGLLIDCFKTIEYFRFRFCSQNHCILSFQLFFFSEESKIDCISDCLRRGYWILSQLQR